MKYLIGILIGILIGHISKKHMARYLDEFSFRWNTRKITDGERCLNALRNTEGKRLLYKTPMKPVY